MAHLTSGVAEVALVEDDFPPGELAPPGRREDDLSVLVGETVEERPVHVRIVAARTGVLALRTASPAGAMRCCSAWCG